MSSDDNQGPRGKILIVCEPGLKQRTMENVLNIMFKKLKKQNVEFVKVDNIADALANLYVKRNEIVYIFCYHSNVIDGIKLLEDWNERFKDIPLVIITNINFVNIAQKVGEAGAIFIQFPEHSPGASSFAADIAKAISKE